MAISVVSFSFSRCSTGGPGAQLSAECWLSLPHLVTNGSPKLLGAPRAPSAGWWLSLPHLVSNSSDLQLPDFLSTPSYIIVQSPTQYLPITCHRKCVTSAVFWDGMFDCHRAEITVMQFRSHSLPVHQSMSVSWAFILSHFVSKIRLRDFFRLLATGMCHFLPVHHFGMACLAGSNVNIQQLQRFGNKRTNRDHEITAFLRILKRALEVRGDLLSLSLQ